MPGELNTVRDKSYSKGKEKGFWKHVHAKKKLDTKEDPHNNHTITDQGQSWDFDQWIKVHPLEKPVWFQEEWSKETKKQKP